MNRFSSPRHRLQNAILAASLSLCAAKTFAVEVEGPAPRSGPAPIIAPIASQLPSLYVPTLTDGVAPQIEAALKPSASIEAVGAAGLNITSILQGGQARPINDTPAVSEAAASASGLPSLPASHVHATVVFETVAPAPPRRTKPAKEDPAAGVLHVVAVLVFLAAAAISWYFFVNAIGDIVRMGEQQMQEQLHDPDMGNNPF
jgi:hypothetical protein